MANQATVLSPEKASILLNDWRTAPQTFMHDVLGINKIWQLQADLIKACIRAFETGQDIYVGSGHSLGKDYICAAISLWFLHCYRPSIVIQTAPTDRQVKKVMYGETLSHWYNRKMDLGGQTFANPYIEFQKDKWYLIGFTTKETGASKEAQGGKFSGFHSQNMCIIVSEAQAIEDNIVDQIDGVIASATGKRLVIYIGNPTRAKGRFAKGLRDKKNNIVFNFSCLDNPNYKHRKEMIPGLASYAWVEDKRRKWGEDDPRWYGRVLGQIPETSVNTVLGADEIEHMKSRHGFLSQHAANAGVSLDPAGEGIDDNIMMGGNGGEILETVAKTKVPPSTSAIKAVELCKGINGSFIIIDCDGVGIGTYQELKKLSPHYLNGIQIIKFHGSAPSEFEVDGKRVYQNMRAEAAFVTKQRGKDGRAALDVGDSELIEDLGEEEYFTNKRGLIQIESKEDIKDRLERSPGRGDAYKMLQWAFSKGYKLIGSVSERDTRPRYGMTDDTMDNLNGQRNYGSSQKRPREGVTWE